VAALAVIIAGVVAAACGSSAATVPTSSTAASAAGRTVVAHGVVGKRYCEVLLVHAGTGGYSADVYNTYGLNDCPAAQWAAVDATAIARENGAVVAVLNGPRYWLMDSIAKVRTGTPVVKSFGGMAMTMEATVVIGPSLVAAQTPFVPHAVSRQASFTFASGRQVYELTDPGGTVWVMQTYSQIKDPTLSAADLPGLAPRLTLPTGWTYRARTLTRPLVVATSSHAAQVLQDNLMNSYSKETAG
jgi:hypothetical protein